MYRASRNGILYEEGIIRFLLNTHGGGNVELWRETSHTSSIHYFPTCTTHRAAVDGWMDKVVLDRVLSITNDCVVTCYH